MKTLLQRFAAIAGFIMFLGAGAIDSHPAVAFAWLSASIALLLAGRAFAGQQKQCRPAMNVVAPQYGDYPSEAWDKLPAIHRPLHVEPHIYQALADALSEKIADRDYLPMTMLEVEDDGGLLFRFAVSAVIYRREESLPEGAYYPISKVVPVWWELHSFRSDAEVCNDATFDRLNEYIINQ